MVLFRSGNNVVSLGQATTRLSLVGQQRGFSWSPNNGVVFWSGNGVVVYGQATAWFFLVRQQRGCPFIGYSVVVFG